MGSTAKCYRNKDDKCKISKWIKHIWLRVFQIYSCISYKAWVKKMKQVHTIMIFLQYIEHDKDTVVHT